MLVDSLQKQEEGRARGSFVKGRSGKQESGREIRRLALLGFEKSLASAKPRPKIGARLGCRPVIRDGRRRGVGLHASSSKGVAAMLGPAASLEKSLASASPRAKIGARLGCRSVVRRGLQDRDG